MRDVYISVTEYLLKGIYISANIYKPLNFIYKGPNFAAHLEKDG